MTDQSIYDETLVEALPRYDGRYPNPWVVALCKRDHNGTAALRGEIEQWYSEYAESAKRSVSNRLRQRLRSADDSDHTPAFYELFFHRYLRSKGWHVEIEPTLPDGKPEFFVTTPSGSRFVVEVYTFMEMLAVDHAKERVTALIRAIDRLEPEFLYSLHLEAYPSRHVDPSVVAEFLIRSYRESPPATDQSIRVDLRPVGAHCTVTCWAWPGVSGCGGTSGPLITLNDYPDSLRGKLEAKAQKYKHTEVNSLGYVIALGTDNDKIERDFVSEALYGQRVIRWNIDDPNGRTWDARDNNGLFCVDEQGQFSCRNVSGVLLCRRKMSDAHGFVFEISLFHHPGTRDGIALQTDVFLDLPQFGEVYRDSEVFRFDWINPELEPIPLRAFSLVC